MSTSVIQNYSHYQSNWQYADAWGLRPFANCSTDEDDAQLQDGLSLLHSGDLVYSISAQTPATTAATSSVNGQGMILYLFCYFLRTLTIQPDGIILSD
jgi:hypothetical protein